MERFIPPRDSYYDPEHPVDSDDELEPLGGWNPENPPLHAEQEPREPIPPPTYTEADLHPTTPDPRCDPVWPLACYWPVYVSNFRLDDLAEDARNGQVGKFFAAQGLLTRMVFFWEPRSNYLSHFQRPSRLFDMLVYFTSEEDAGRAVRLCHRLSYYGHRLNVWPGRSPIWFDNSRSIRFQLSKMYCAKRSETIIELILRKHHGPCVRTVAMFDVGDVVVEFSSEESMREAIRASKYWLPKKLEGPTKKQRYLEREVEEDLLKAIADKPEFLDMVPAKEVLQQLLAGRIPDVDRSWENVDRPRQIPESVQDRYDKDRQRRKDRLIRNAERKRKGGGNALLDGAPSLKKSLTLRGKRDLVRQQADQILRKGHPGGSTANNYKRNILAKKNQYGKLKQAFTEAAKNKKCAQTSKDLKDLFYNMLALEEELMDILPYQYEEIFDTLQLETGLSKAVLIAGYMLPFPVCPPPETIEEFYEDVPPPCDETPEVPKIIPTVRPYSPADLNPTVLDPSCDPIWPLANLWPVYVDNFRLNTLSVARRNEQIHNYFAAKGLLATRIFIPDNNPKDFLYKRFQTKVMLLDMLVYFTSQEDAQKAIQLCHRESYYGHYLNVFPGREALFYDFDRSGYCHVDRKPKFAQHPQFFSTTYFEETILEVLPQDVSCVTRHEKYCLHFEFVKRDPLDTVLPHLASEVTTKSGIQKRLIRKQRFLESDQKELIMEKLLADPTFFNAQPKPELLGALYAGSVPSELINWNWVGWAGPRKPGIHQKLYARVKEFYERISDVLQVWLEMQK